MVTLLNELSMMETLTRDFCNVMYKYRVPFTRQGVLANLMKWRANKAELIEVLRRHPNWDEREMAVVFRVTEKRSGTDQMKVDEAKFEMMELARRVIQAPDELDNFSAALDAATADYANVPDESRLDTIQLRGGIRCGRGQKSSRIINRLCLKFGLDGLQEEVTTHGGEQRMTTPYNSIFARLADALNPVEIGKTAVLSVHPCDFLEMSNKDDSWHSCHCLADGGWRGGCQSYMGDGVSMVFFTVDEGVTEDFHRYRKVNRQIFCFRDGLLLQSRLYPNDDDDLCSLYRNLVQNVLSRCLGVSNLWRRESGIEYSGYTHEILWTTYYWTAKNDKAARERKEYYSVHYPDYDNGYAIVSYLKDAEDKPCRDMVIGSETICPCCGKPHKICDSVWCQDCNPMVICADCGEEILFKEALYAEGRYHCSACAHKCQRCNRIFTGEVYHGFNGLGEVIDLCHDCYEGQELTCESCSVHGICAILGGGRMCSRARQAAA